MQMKNKLDIIFISLLLGLMMAAGLTIADGLSYSTNLYVNAEDFAEAEYNDCTQLESRELFYPHISNRRRSSSLAQRLSANKSHSRQGVSKTTNTTSTKEHLLLNYSIRHICSAEPQSLNYGNTIIVRLHRLLI